MAKKPEASALFTIGHSNQPLDAFLGLLETHDVGLLADIRRYPGSRRWPWFGKDALSGSLREHGILYRHFPRLGGRRSPAPDSPNGAWRVAQFQAYADYMATPEFQAALDELIETLPERPVAVMCAEVLPWRCHRNLLADAVVVRGIPVFHIMGHGDPKPHALPAFAKVDRRSKPPRLTYPPTGEVQARLRPYRGLTRS